MMLVIMINMLLVVLLGLGNNVGDNDKYVVGGIVGIAVIILVIMINMLVVILLFMVVMMMLVIMIMFLVLLLMKLVIGDDFGYDEYVGGIFGDFVMMVIIVNMLLVICIDDVVDGGKCFDGNCANDGDYGKFI